MPRARRSKKAAAPASAEPAARLLRGPEAARPLASLIFLAPWLLLYVVGLVWVRPDLAAGADILLRELLTLFGVSGALAPTWLAIIVLVLWHLLRRDPWKISWGLLGLMAAETLLLAVPLFALERVFHAPPRRRPAGVGRAFGVARGRHDQHRCGHLRGTPVPVADGRRGALPPADGLEG
jgi:hypothetical protein